MYSFADMGWLSSGLVDSIYNEATNCKIGDKDSLSPIGLSEEKLVELAQRSPSSLIEARSIIPGICSVCLDGYESIVYRYRSNNNTDFAIKIRKPIVLKTTDLRIAFDVELLRRKDLEGTDFKNYDNTVYLSHNNSIIVSKWINGRYIKELSEISKQTFLAPLKIFIELGKRGLYDSDINLRNIIYSDDFTPYLFDFGSVYRFDPHKEMNPFGVTKNTFDILERYKDTHAMRFLAWLERHNKRELAINSYKLFVEAYIVSQKEWIDVLEDIGADNWIVAKEKKNLLWYSDCFKNGDLLRLYGVDRFISGVLTLEEAQYYELFDESYTIKARELLTVLDEYYPFICESEWISSDEKSMNKSELLLKYKNRYFI